MKKSFMSIATPKDFHFWRTVYSHGWCALPPFSVNKDRHSLHRIMTVDETTIVSCELTSNNNAKLTVQSQSSKLLSKSQKNTLERLIRSCLRLDENFNEFYRDVRKNPKHYWMIRAKAGRLLRAPTAFEDIVKMICTTNCSWALTEIMVKNLTGELGKKFDSNQFDFPTPEALAGVTESFIRKTIRAGYRAPFLLELAERVARKQLDIESWRTELHSTEELYKLLRSIKGVGDYAAGNLLKLLGHYDRLGIDSWVRSQFYSLYHKGRKVSDTRIEKHYAEFGKWRGLIIWLEMTRDWFDQEYPF